LFQIFLQYQAKGIARKPRDKDRTRIQNPMAFRISMVLRYETKFDSVHDRAPSSNGGAGAFVTNKGVLRDRSLSKFDRPTKASRWKA
jgi:hypothetical protein